ncbi:MAG TPA: glycosyltransferase [Spongiibacteraceae bacterium]|nr:glycosyltransferase [Spongiibacteraceae bacterium]
MEKIRIYVASTPAEWLPTRVLEFSIKEATSREVIVTPIYTLQRTFPLPKSANNRPRTPFSFQRFLIPEFCDFKGRAIYFDADMLVFSDISELWGQDFQGCDLLTVETGNSGRRNQFSVMLLDCEKLNWNIEQIICDLDSGKLDYNALMYEMRVAKKINQSICSAWNSLEQYHPGTTRLLHYTDMNTQPWISTKNPLGHLWVKCLRRAIATNFITREELASEVEKGRARPSLLAQIDLNIDDSLTLASAICKQDRDFIAPYRRLQSGSSRPWTSLGSAAKAFLRRAYYHSPIARLFR